MRKTILPAAFALLAAASFAQAETLDATHIGTLNDIGYSLSSFRAGFVELGLVPLAPDSLNFATYAIFDLSGVGTITSATLRLRLSNYTSEGPFLASSTPLVWDTISNPTEAFTVFDVTATLAELTATYTDPTPGLPLEPNPDGTAIFSDLSSGLTYGDFLASAAAVGNDLDVVLNAGALNAMNASGGTFAVGIAFTGTKFSGFLGQLGAPLVNQTIEFPIDPEQQQLIIATSVPEPSTWILFASGCLVLVVYNCRRRQRVIVSIAAL